MIKKLRAEMGQDTPLLHYLATPPSSFRHFTEAFQAHNLNQNATVIYEKPYGTSSEDFEQLDEFVHSVFDEEQVFRIDHFLGKEATQNLHAGALW